MDARVTADARVSFSWLLLFGQAKRSNRLPWMADENHTDVSRFSQERQKPNREPTPSPPSPPLEGEGSSEKWITARSCGLPFGPFAWRRMFASASCLRSP